MAIDPRTVFQRRLARTYHQAVRARAEVEQMPELVAAARNKLLEIELEDDPHSPMARLADRLALGTQHVELVWTLVACSVDGRIVPHLETLGGAHARRGLSLSVYAMLAELDDDSVADLAHWLATGNPLVAVGLVVATEPASPAARAHVAGPRLISFLLGDDQIPE